jgi:hypothetical protein
MTCLDLPHDDVSLDVTSYQEVLSHIITSNATDSMRMTVVKVP